MPGSWPGSRRARRSRRPLGPALRSPGVAVARGTVQNRPRSDRLNSQIVIGIGRARGYGRLEPMSNSHPGEGRGWTPGAMTPPGRNPQRHVPLRILMINYEYPPFGGGTGLACSQLLDELAGFPALEIELVTSGPERRVEVARPAPSIQIHRLPIRKRADHFWRAPELAEWTVRALAYSRRLVATRSFDLCHCWSGWPAGLVGRALGGRVRYLVSLRGSDVPGYNRPAALARPDPVPASCPARVAGCGLRRGRELQPAPARARDRTQGEDRGDPERRRHRAVPAGQRRHRGRSVVRRPADREERGRRPVAGVRRSGARARRRHAHDCRRRTREGPTAGPRLGGSGSRSG